MSKSRWKESQTVRDLVPDDTVVQPLKATTRAAAVAELVDALVVIGAIEVGKERGVREAILAREDVASTGLGNGIALPHAKSKFSPRLGLAVGLSEEGIDIGAHDQIPAFVFLLWVCPPNATQEHLALMRGFALIARDANLAGQLAACKERRSLFSFFESVSVE